MITVTVKTKYAAVCTDEIAIPVQAWSDIQTYLVKHGKFHYLRNGAEKWESVDLMSEVTGESVDWKRPDSVEIKDALTDEILISEES